MRDVDIRASLSNQLAAQHGRDPGAVVRHELGICLGQARVDVAVVNGALAGFEIKSERDSLRRLPRQVELYGLVLDYATIVTCGRYVAKVAELVPWWWGVMLAVDADDLVELEHMRPAARNEAVDAYAVAQLLWRQEAYDILKRLDLHRGLATATRFCLWRLLADSLPLAVLQSEVRHHLRVRQAWSADRQQRPYGVRFPPAAK